MDILNKDNVLHYMQKMREILDAGPAMPRYFHWDISTEQRQQILADVENAKLTGLAQEVMNKYF